MVCQRTLLARLAAGAAAAALLATAPARAAAPAFDQSVESAKTAMMADPSVALRHARAALAAARKDGQPVRVATAEWLQGEALLRLDRLDEAEPAIRDGLAIVARQTPNTKLHGDLMMALGAVLATQGKVQPALADFQAAYRIFGAAKVPRSQAIALQNIGSIYQDAGDYPKVLEYYAHSAELVKDDPSLLLSAHHNVANALKAQKKYAEAIAELAKALAIARNMKSPLLEAHILGNMASTETARGRSAEAQRYLDAGLGAASTPAAASERPYLYGVAAELARSRGDFAGAAKFLDRTFAGEDLARTSLLFRDFHRIGGEVYERTGDTPLALAHWKAFQRLDAEARELAASTNAALMAAQFNFANQASRIARLKAGQLQRDIQLAEARNAFTRVALVGASIIVVLLVVGILWIRRSRNEVRAANKLLENALAARTEFLATTSHEIRTPLNGILGMTEVILRDRSLDPVLRDKLAVVHGAGETMRSLVDDILDVAKIETGKLAISPAEMDLKQLFDGAVRLWTERAASKGLLLVADVDSAPSRIIADSARLRQILFNLMSNAIKFTEEGTIALSAAVEAGPDGGELLVLRVIDSGIGIPEDRLDAIFESFSQVDGSVTRIYGGTGLGLTICRSLAEAMGGSIDVSSRLGAGSTFTVRLPLRRADGLGSSATVAPAAAARFEDCRILLVDANPLSQAVVRAVLQPQLRGFAVAATREEAATAACAGQYDIVLTDAAALHAEPGERAVAARALSEDIAPAALVVMAADLSDADAARFLRAGAAQIIRKPIPAPALVAELKAGFEARFAQNAVRAEVG